jgi:hypothetical protein
MVEMESKGLIKHIGDGQGEALCGGNGPERAEGFETSDCKACVHAVASQTSRELARVKEKLDAVNTRASFLQTYTG